MIRTIRAVALAGLIAVALSAWMFHAYLVDLFMPEAIQEAIQEAVTAQIVLQINALLGFSARLLTLTLSVPRRQRPWSAALLVSLILNGYWPSASFSDWWFVLIPPLASAMLAVPFVVQFLVAALVPATPALLALGYTIRAAGRATPAPQVPQTLEEGSLEITIEPIES